MIRTAAVRQPQIPTPIDWGNPVTRGLAGALVAMPRTRHGYDAVTGKIGEWHYGAAAHSIRIGRAGGYFYLSTIYDDLGARLPTNASLLRAGASVVEIVTPTQAASTEVWHQYSPGAGSDGVILGLTTSNQLQGSYRLTYQGALQYLVATEALSPGLYVLAWGYFGGVLSLYANGKVVASAAVNFHWGSDLQARLGPRSYGTPLHGSGVRVSAVNGWSREMSPPEMASIGANFWQVFLAEQTTPVAAAAGGSNGSATTAPPSLTVVAAAASATGTTVAHGSATGALSALTVSAPVATAAGVVTGSAAGVFPSLTVVAPVANAAGTSNGNAVGTFAAVTLAAAQASATGEVVSNVLSFGGFNSFTFNGAAFNGGVSAATGAQANAVLAPVLVTAAAATASGVANVTATASMPAVTLVAPVASADAAANATGFGSLASVSVTAPAASATATMSGLAQGALASVLVVAPGASGQGSALASGGLPAVTVVAPAASASSVNWATAYGAMPAVTVSAPQASAQGTANASAALASVSVVAPVATASNQTHAQAVAGFDSISVVPALAGATGTSNGNALASFAAVSIAPPAAVAIGPSYFTSSYRKTFIRPRAAASVFYRNPAVPTFVRPYVETEFRRAA